MNDARHILYRDIESRSTLNLKAVGAWHYAGDPSTAVWCVGYAVDDGPVQIWIPGQPIPEEFHTAAHDPDWLIVAHNDAFERAIEERILAPRYGWPTVPIGQHRCTMAMALAAALPAKLETIAAALDLPIGKDIDGAKVMREMSRPRRARPDEDPRGIYWIDDPEKLRRLIAYNVRDVEVERELYRRLPPLLDSEQALWVLDAAVNRRGFHVDVALAEAANKIVRDRRYAIDRELIILTDGRITSVGQVARIGDYLKERGHHVTGVGKRNVAAVLAHNPNDDVARLLRLRQEGGKSSANKLDALLAMANDDRIHGALKFHGAATGRWSGHGFQPHNLARATPADPEAAIAAVRSGDLARATAIGPPLEVVGSLSRAMICAAPGKSLIGADYSSIEPRVLCWLAGETWKLDAFRKFDATGDLAFENYCLVASRVLGRTVTPDDEEDRQIGKYMDLAFGYGGALGAFRRIAPDADFTDAQVEAFKRQWRAAHPKIVKFWGDLHRMLLRAVRTGKPAALRNLSAEMRGGVLYMRLPSGREVAYPEARIESGQYSDEIVFKDSALGKWRDARGWHGTFTENVVQAISRDLLAAAMQRIEAAGYPIVLHVHDEIVAEVAEDFGSPEDFTRIMLELPAWAEGLPLAAKGSRRARYAKDKNGTKAMDEDEPLIDEDVSSETEGPAAPPPPWDSSETEASTANPLEVASPAVAAAIAAINAAMPSGTIIEHSDGEHDQRGRGQSRGDYGDDLSEKYSGKPYTDRHLRRQGYQLARTFVYELPDGTALYEERRYELRAGIEPTKERPRKTCRFCHCVGGVDLFDTGSRRIIYNWPAIMRDGPDAVVHITEGANKSAALNAAGLLATAVAYHKWEPECVSALAGRHLIYHEDHDLDDDEGRNKGREFSADARKKLAPVAASFRVVPAAHLFRHIGREPWSTCDVKDWLEAGGDAAKITDICRELPDENAATLGEWDAGDDIEPPPPREWLLGNIFCRRFVSSLYGDGGAGKTALRYTQYLALATGKELTGEHVFQRCRVLIVSLEDDDQELKRRIRATRLYHNIDVDEVRGWLFLSAPGNKVGKLMELDNKGRTQRSTLADILDATIIKRKIDLVSLDPFVKSHAVDENMNKQIDAVMEVLTDLTAKHNIAIDIPHHTRKGAADPGNADRGRGASAQKNAGRLIYTLTPMTAEEGKAFGIEDEQRHALIRMDSGKVNIAPKLWKAQWFRLVGVQLDNATELYPHGDNVQTAEPWTPPDVWEDLDAARINRILDKIDAGLADGRRYSDASRAEDRAAWKVVVDEMPEKTEAQAREIIKTWVKNGLLERKKYEDPVQRREQSGLFVCSAKRPSQTE